MHRGITRSGDAVSERAVNHIVVAVPVCRQYLLTLVFYRNGRTCGQTCKADGVMIHRSHAETIVRQ